MFSYYLKAKNGIGLFVGLFAYFSFRSTCLTLIANMAAFNKSNTFNNHIIVVLYRI